MLYHTPSHSLTYVLVLICPKLHRFCLNSVRDLWAAPGPKAPGPKAYCGLILGDGGGYFTGWVKVHHYEVCYNLSSFEPIAMWVVFGAEVSRFDHFLQPAPSRVYDAL